MTILPNQGGYYSIIARWVSREFGSINPKYFAWCIHILFHHYYEIYFVWDHIIPIHESNN